MAFQLKDLIISIAPAAGGEQQFCPTASAGRCAPASVQVVFCAAASAPVLVMPATPAAQGQAQFCPTASAPLQFCPTASAEAVAAACPTASAPAESAAAGPEGLAALKQQLQQALAQVEEQEKAWAASRLPQTLAEAEDLEAKLREALEELQRHKETLKG